jgi:oxygen-dependent protoporphyrinogen oxidase
MSSTDTIIIGSGISALIAANTLRVRGKRCLLLESSDHIGGAIHTVEEQGYRLELGPNTLQLNDEGLERILRELGVLENAIEANPQANKRFLVRNRRVIAAPQSPMQALTSPLLSFQAKLRVLREPFISKYSGADESLASFVKRRLGKEFLDYLINPMVGGVYAGLPEQLSVKHAFPKVYNLEQEHGSLIRGAIAKMLEKRRSKSTFKTRLLGWKAGMKALINQLAKSLEIRTQASIQKISQRPDKQWEVVWTHASASDIAVAPNLIVTTPTHAWKTIPFLNDLALAEKLYEQIEYPPVTVVALGFRRAQIKHPLDGFGMLIPQCENYNILGTLFSSTLFPERAPEGHVLLTTFIGGARQPENTRTDKATAIDRTRKELAGLLGIEGQPDYSYCYTWDHAIPQYKVGYGDYLHAFDQTEEHYKGLHLIGNYRDGIALGKCVLAAHHRAQAIE